MEDAEIRKLVFRVAPQYAPFRVKSVPGLAVRVYMFKREEDVMHMHQQAILAEAFAANDRGESLDYLIEASKQRNYSKQR